MIIEKKLLGIFLLNDLEFSKIKDEINEGLNDKLNEISEEFVKTNTFYGGQHIRYLLKERIKRIREIVKIRLNLDCIFRKDPDTVSGNIRTAFRNYPDTLSNH